MKINRKIIIIIYLLLINFSYAWWNESFEYCRELTLNETVGINRNFEVVDIPINTSDWIHKPSENSTRLVDSGCFDNGKEITHQIYNKSLDNGFLQASIWF